MDEFKKYIQNNARELDLDEPGEQVWQNIRRGSAAVKKPSVVLMVTRWAAAACILALAGIGLWSVLSNKKDVPAQTEIAVAPAKVDTPAAREENILPEEIVPETKQEPLLAAAKTKPHPKNKTLEKPAHANDAALATLRNIESSFTQVINLQRDRVSSMPMYAESPEYFDDFKIQIKQMERDEKVIKSDIAKRGMNDQLLDQLINLYQQKLNTLKQLQIEMNKTNNRYKQNRVPVDPVKTYFLNL
ncbi:hypothetical protein GWC95_01225 [Sediminibacterium roseum]|uniref:Uncharacterized protein n=1 Tax=Sediminibacterium roseum TaxID=1978412 RepID=A0ABW9ZN77_9BACT|nr:hypothetical protein [Sediminibacterium roseum]NCI48524.1 hypothetical protein [Sediminibacterium roseum]